MPFFDTHTHSDALLHELGLTLGAFLKECERVQIAKIMVMGTSKRNFSPILSLCEKAPTVLLPALGLHPLYIQQHQKADLDQLEKLIQTGALAAIGEIGLERYIRELTIDQWWFAQCAYFEAQLQLASHHQLPVSIHARKAHNEVYRFLKNSKVQGVIHGFSGSLQEAMRYVDLGFKIGVGGTITYLRASKTRETIARLPLNSLVLETDSPDMPIAQRPGQLNRPVNLVFIFQALCEIRSEPCELLATQLWHNSEAVFISH
ncbi:MAG: deoxyribonuclease [Francisella sp.]|jgi:tatD family deoxyribonuclease|nr:MAG: deoxyribonuclease [Francisella sp.]